MALNYWHPQASIPLSNELGTQKTAKARLRPCLSCKSPSFVGKLFPPRLEYLKLFPLRLECLKLFALRVEVVKPRTGQTGDLSRVVQRRAA